MSDEQVTLVGNKDSVSLNSSDTVSVFAYQHTTTNQTRTTTFTPRLLLEWAKRVDEAYGDDPSVEIVFTPEKPIVARKAGTDKDPHLGIALAPRIFKNRDESEA